ncbi:sugar phosphate isomerase/epimerase [Cytophagaceae bacterium 50C-KIRBA]|uniref:Sugar phosphate isomerase/epimerase n=1 Tax=Aquirufa beregesia TaxID=2516556 RepID=A0ABX0F6D2_9BACT|nr:sugar phosphate isomerase/epimerase [Aquirufa beregesia]NGZ45435.1 sugar phosphate isomerase/epimerase [Aquirufa beregesia]
MKAFFLLLLLPTLAFAQKPMQINGKDIGMVSFTYRNSLSKNMAKTLDTLKNQGITDMEFSSLFGKTAQEVRDLLDERGMKCSSFGVNMADALNKTDQVGENAKTLGASFVRVAWIPHTGPFTLEMAQKTAQEFNQIGKALKEKYDLTFCYHNHGFEFEPYGEGTLFDYLVQNTDPKFVSYEMDILWTFFPGQNPASLLEKYGNRFKLVHLKDLKKGVQGNMSGGTSVENDVALGSGQLNIPEIMKAAKKAKIQHYYLEDESSRYPVQTRQSRTYLSNLK